MLCRVGRRQAFSRTAPRTTSIARTASSASRPMPPQLPTPRTISRAAAGDVGHPHAQQSRRPGRSRSQRGRGLITGRLREVRACAEGGAPGSGSDSSAACPPASRVAPRPVPGPVQRGTAADWARKAGPLVRSVRDSVTGWCSCRTEVSGPPLGQLDQLGLFGCRVPDGLDPWRRLENRRPSDWFRLVGLTRARWRQRGRLCTCGGRRHWRHSLGFPGRRCDTATRLSHGVSGERIVRLRARVLGDGFREYLVGVESRRGLCRLGVTLAPLPHATKPSKDGSSRLGSCPLVSDSCAMARILPRKFAGESASPTRREPPRRLTPRVRRGSRRVEGPPRARWPP